MADDGLEKFEAALGAISKITSEDTELVGARCPKCEASDFVKVSDLYTEAVGRLQEQPDAPGPVREGGMTDRQIVAKFTPPRRKTVAGVVIAFALPLSGGAYYVYWRFGNTPGQIAAAASVILMAIVLMTSLRRLSDQYYNQRRRWRSLHMCRRCGQLVA